MARQADQLANSKPKGKGNAVRVPGFGFKKRVVVRRKK